jgi:hypothetical protein
MKSVVLTLVLAAAAFLGFSADDDSTFTGEIMDKQCAQMQSHDNMMQAEGAHNARECSLNCTKNGDQFALFDPITKKVYVLDDEKQARQYAGQKVRISGDYKDDVLHIKNIAAVGR